MVDKSQIFEKVRKLRKLYQTRVEEDFKVGNANQLMFDHDVLEILDDIARYLLERDYLS